MSRYIDVDELKKQDFQDYSPEDVEYATPTRTGSMRSLFRRGSRTLLRRESRIKRLAEFAKLRADGVTVMYGDFAGQLLADILEGDLMENESIKGEKICRT